MIRESELLALLDELEPYPATAGKDPMVAAGLRRRVFAARRAIAEDHGWGVLDLIRSEMFAAMNQVNPWLGEDER